MVSTELKRLTVGLLHTNTYILLRDEVAVVIDPGTVNDEEIQEIRKIIGDRRLAAVICTHGHYDHVCGAVYLNAEKYYIHRRESIILEDSSWWAENFYKSPLKLPEKFDYLEGGEILNFNGIVLEIIHTPGHSPGSICILSKELNALFTGDTLFKGTHGRTDFKGGSMKDMLETLKKFLEMDDSLTIYPGHGDISTLGEEKKWIRNLYL